MKYSCDSAHDSVENMLQWQVELARKRALEMQESLVKCGELYPLPNPNDGLPKEWAFGKFTYQQVTLAQAIKGLKLVFHEIEKTVEALLNGELPTAIFWIIKVNQSINSTASLWQSASAVRTYRYVDSYRGRQSIIGQKPRKKKPSKQELQISRDAYFALHGHYQRWLKQAQRQFSLSPKTLNLIMGSNEK